jgi:hypothetical protein
MLLSFDCPMLSSLHPPQPRGGEPEAGVTEAYLCQGTAAAEGATAPLPGSAADPDPDPPDPHVFGPPGSGSFFH